MTDQFTVHVYLKNTLKGLVVPEFEKAVRETLGVTAIGDVDKKLKSWNSTTTKKVKIQVVSSNSVHVWIPNSDNSGKKGTVAGYTAIYVD